MDKIEVLNTNDNYLDEIEIVRADLEDVNTAIAIIEEVANWTMTTGFPNWQATNLKRVVVPASERGELYLARIEGEAAATFILQWEDEYFWGKRPEDAGYIHKLAVRRKFAGQNVGRQILQWAEQKVNEVGRKYLRLDCQAYNPAINKYYQEAGFTFIGSFGDQKWNLYEKAVS